MIPPASDRLLAWSMTSPVGLAFDVYIQPELLDLLAEDLYLGGGAYRRHRPQRAGR